MLIKIITESLHNLTIFYSVPFPRRAHNFSAFAFHRLAAIPNSYNERGGINERRPRSQRKRKNHFI